MYTHLRPQLPRQQQFCNRSTTVLQPFYNRSTTVLQPFYNQSEYIVRQLVVRPFEMLHDTEHEMLHGMLLRSKGNFFVSPCDALSGSLRDGLG